MTTASTSGQPPVSQMEAGAVSPAPPAEPRLEELRRALEAERGARLRAEAAAEWSAFLGEAGRILASSLAYRATLRAVARLVVPRFADWCMVDLVEPEGGIRRVVVAAEPEQEEIARVLRDVAPRPDAPVGSARVIRTGEPEVVTVTDELLRAMAVSEEHLEAMRAVQARSYLCVPLVAHGAALGSLMLLAAHSGRSYTGEELSRATELAGLVALAIDNARLHAAEQRARLQAERMQGLTAALTAALTQEEIGSVVMRDGVVAMGAYAGVIVQRTDAGDELEIVASTGYANGCMLAGQRWPVAAPMPIAEAAREGESVFVGSPEEWARRYGKYTPTNSASAAWAAIPLRTPGGQSTTGAMLWTWDRPRRFSPDERALLDALGRQSAQALERARLHEAERQARLATERAMERVHRLQQITAALSEARTADDVAEVVVEQGIAALGARAGSIAVVDAELGEMRILRAVGYTSEAVERFRRFSLEIPFPMADAARTGEAVVLTTAAERDARYPHLSELRRSNGDGAMAAIPLRVGERVIGAIGLNFPEAVPLQDDDRDFLVTLAQQCAQAMERARLFDAERQARAEAEQANQAKSQFLSTMSHELRTPLNAIDGYAELMEMELHGSLTAEQRQDVARIRRSQRHLLTLINDVLFFARTEAGHLTLRDQPVALGPLLEELEQLMLPQLRAKELELRCAVPELGLVARADPDRLQQILLNLVSNAIKFTPPGGSIRVEARREGEQAVVAVQDTGIGIPPEKLESVFDPFVQLGRDLTSSHEGTGLGLAISRDLARAMAGELRALSAPGEGATFVLTLPAG